MAQKLSTPRICAAPECEAVIGYGPHGPEVACHNHRPPGHTHALNHALWTTYWEWGETYWSKDGLAYQDYVEARDAVLAYVDRYHGAGRPAMLAERAEAMAELRTRVNDARLSIDDGLAEVLRGDYIDDGSNLLPSAAARWLAARGVRIPARLLADRPELSDLTDSQQEPCK